MSTKGILGCPRVPEHEICGLRQSLGCLAYVYVARLNVHAVRSFGKAAMCTIRDLGSSIVRDDRCIPLSRSSRIASSWCTSATSNAANGSEPAQRNIGEP